MRKSPERFLTKGDLLKAGAIVAFGGYIAIGGHLGISGKASAEANTPKVTAEAKPHNSQPKPQAPVSVLKPTPNNPDRGKYSLTQLLQAIALHESQGKPTAFNPEGGGAHGKYQYETDTWTGEAATYYPPALAYANADEAPQAVQDALTYLRYLHIYTRFNENPRATATYNYYPALADDTYYNANSPALNYAPPSNHGLTIKMYDDQVMNILEAHKATNIPMLQEEAPEFDYWHQKALEKLSQAGRAEMAADVGSIYLSHRILESHALEVALLAA